PMRRSRPLSAGRGAPAASAAVLRVELAAAGGSAGMGAAGVEAAAAGRSGGPPRSGSVPTAWLRALQPVSRSRPKAKGESRATGKKRKADIRFSSWALDHLSLSNLPILTCFAYKLD